MVKRSTVVFVSSLVLGTVLLILGLVFLLNVFPEMFKKKINENLELRNGTDQTKRFIDSPVPAYLKFYFFNVTNKDDVNNGSKPILQELGPYVFREEKLKIITAWHEETGSVQYNEKVTYYFEPNMTEGDLSDEINHINAVGIGIRAQLLKLSLGSYIHLINGSYVETHTVDQLIFTGFSFRDNIPKIAAFFICPLLNNCMFAFYYGKNGSISEPYEVSTGSLGMGDYTDILLYNNQRQLPFWYGPTCNEINGTDGRQFPPGISRKDEPYVFNADVCRSLRFHFDQDVSVEKIDALRFVIPEDVLADPNKNKDNMCFCEKNSTAVCPTKAGIVSLSTCQNGQPVLISAPHFYQGEQEYWEAFEGLYPNKSLHESFLNIEPFTGMVIYAAKRIQINVDVEPDSRLPFLRPIKNETYFPVFWAEEGGIIDSKSASDFREQVLGPYNKVKSALIAVSVIGGVVLLIALIVVVIKKIRTSGVPYSNVSNDE